MTFGLAITVSDRPLPRCVRAAAIVSLGLALACSGCKKPSSETSATELSPPEIQPPAAESKSSPESKPADVKKARHIEGYAVWYDVPDNSLAKRRAGKDELTAAHNRLPLGTMVRVTRLENGMSVIVRITDRGVRSRVGLIDLCKEAAEKLEMISKGRALVRLEILPEDRGMNAAPDPTSSAANP